MTRKVNRKIQDINGLGIYHDPKHGTVYYDIFTKRAFNLTTSDLKPCLYYTSLLPTVVVAVLALISFSQIKWTIALCVGVIAYIAAEILFRVLYFYKLPEIDNYKPVKNNEPFLVRFAKKYSPQRLVVLAILFVIMAVCIVLYERIESTVQYALIAGYVMAALCIVGAILSLIALAIKKKNNY